MMKNKNVEGDRKVVMILGKREKNIVRPVIKEAQGENPYLIRPLYRDEWDDAMALAWRTFMKFEACDYTQEGVNSFQDFITDSVLHKMFVMGVYQVFGAFENGKIVGVISLRNETHISLLFVEAAYHKRGIGRALIKYVSEYICNEEGFERMTVNASPYAVGFYHRLGFCDLGEEETNDGIRYTPMECRIGNSR